MASRRGASFVRMGAARSCGCAVFISPECYKDKREHRMLSISWFLRYSERLSITQQHSAVILQLSLSFLSCICHRYLYNLLIVLVSVCKEKRRVSLLYSKSALFTGERGRLTAERQSRTCPPSSCRGISRLRNGVYPQLRHFWVCSQTTSQAAWVL